MRTIILADHILAIKNNLFETNFKNSKVLSFNIGVHKILEKEGIPHEIAETYLNSKDRESAYNLTLNLYEWYLQDPILKDLKFQNVNLFGMLDTAEFHQLLISNLIDFLLVKKILEKEKPDKIFTTKNLFNSVKILTLNTKIDVIIYGSETQYQLPWDNIHIKFNLGRIPISFFIGRKKYLKILNIVELMFSKIFNLYVKPNDKKSILLLEFDPSKYVDLLSCINQNNANVVLLNRRRTALWSLSSIRSVLHSKCKIINYNKLLSHNKNEIESLVTIYNKKLDKIFSNNSIFDKIFSFESISFWLCIKPILKNTYKNRISEYISLLISSKEILKKIHFNSILALNIIGETEKSIIEINENKIPFILLEHGFSNHTPELKKFDIFHMYPLVKNKIAVWGNIQKNYLLNERNMDSEKILVTGSPRHDPFFKKPVITNNSKKIILITPHPITNLSGMADTNLYLRFELLLQNLCTTIKKIPNTKIIIKLHPGQDEYNNEIINLLHKIDSNIQIYQLHPIIDLIKSSDLLINISPESFDTSTVIMEGLIMNKPVLNIVQDDIFYQFPFVQENAILSISDKSDLAKTLNDMLFNENLKSNLISNGKIFLEKYLVNHGNASKNLAKILTSF